MLGEFFNEHTLKYKDVYPLEKECLLTVGKLQMKERRSVAEVLFTRTQRKILAILFGQPEQRYYGNELIRLAGVGTGSTRNFLQALVDRQP